MSMLAPGRNRFASAFEVQQFPLGEVRRHSGSPSAEVEALPYYQAVPKDRAGQLKWRLYMCERGMWDAEFRQLVIECCRQDILFFANTFLWVFEPRPFPRYLPMNTWPDQDDNLVWMDQCFGVRDCGIEKSRGVGMSYNLLTVFFKHWLFDRNCKMGLVSKDEDSVDQKGNESSLMGKLDKMYWWLPVWMRQDEDGYEILERAYGDHRFNNVLLNSSITGYAATGDVATGGRMTAIGMDEFGKFKPGEDTHALKSTQHVTNCRYWPSTYKGNSNEFFKLLNPQPGHESTMLKIVADWKDNPERSRGLYTAVDCELKVLDEGYDYPPDYQHILDGKVRSVWYDAECRRPGATPRAIAEELDRDPRGSTSKFFADDTLRKASKTACEPYFEGEIVFDRNDLSQARFVAKRGGRLKLWLPLAGDQPPWGGPYTLAADIAGGGGGDGSSNSVIQGLDQSRQEQILEFASRDILPADLADYMVALARWLSCGRGDEVAYCGFENNGPLGSQFAKRLRKIGYANLYWRESRDDTGKKRTKFLGFNNPDRGEEILSQLQKAIVYDEIIVHSDPCVREMDEYEYENGILVHKASKMSDDGAAVGKPHGDRAIALAIAFHLHEDRPITYKEPEDMPPPPSSIAAMYAAEEEQQQRRADPWQSIRDELAEQMAPYGMY